ncbi:MAG: NAD(P)/FAD-dependent oxidoreductase [Candidatus Caldarchaeum sp.]
MRIAVVGLGVAGSYLVRRLSQLGFDVVGFERQPREGFKAICAWGTVRQVAKQILEKVGFNFEDYLLHLGEHLTLDNGKQRSTIPLKGLCTYDKARLELDLTKGLRVFYGVTPDREKLVREFDLVIDATGVSRALLPRPAQDEVVPCFEYRIKYGGEKPLTDFYVKIFRNCNGYLWYFPLGDNEAYVGAGDISNNHVREVNAFVAQNGGKIVGKYGRAVRIAPPELSTPFSNGKIVGVGESIGTVFPMLGEGILPSLECAEIFLETLEEPERYAGRVLEFFKPYSDIYRMVKLKQAGELNLVRHLPLIMRCYKYMKDREDRFGMVIRKSDLYLILQS